MELRNIFRILFGRVKGVITGSWKEIGSYQSIFGTFNGDLYSNDLVRSCIRTLAEHSSKANVRVIRRVNGKQEEGNRLLERMIQYSPNMYMNGKDFLYKIRTRLELDNIVFIYIQRDDIGRCSGLYPMPRASYEAVESHGELFIKFL
ncbi:MAG: phage portal protein, partial [Youngiibacter sp.]|nr:phage portal protein [Youngiibacter sp.]